MIMLELWVVTQLYMNSEYRRGLSTQPIGVLVLRVRVKDVVVPIHAAWGLPIRRFRIQSHRLVLSPR